MGTCLRIFFVENGTRVQEFIAKNYRIFFQEVRLRHDIFTCRLSKCPGDVSGIINVSGKIKLTVYFETSD